MLDMASGTALDFDFSMFINKGSSRIGVTFDTHQYLTCRGSQCILRRDTVRIVAVSALH